MKADEEGQVLSDVPGINKRQSLPVWQQVEPECGGSWIMLIAS